MKDTTPRSVATSKQYLENIDKKKRLSKCKNVPHDVYFSHLRSILTSFESVHKTIFKWRSGVDSHGHGQQVQQEDQHLLVEHSLQREEKVNQCFELMINRTMAKVFHFSSNSFAIIPPSNMFKCSGLVPFRMMINAEPQSAKY
jgi:hypothetical protein